MKAAIALAVTGVAAAEFEAEWSQFQAVQGQQNGEIPEAFKANVLAAKANNAANTGFTMGWTGPFAAMTKEEYKGVLGYSAEPHRSLPNLGEHVATEVTVGSVDWTTKGAVTPVKNQGQCGSCWAFSTTGSTEGAFFLAGNQLTSLSEQQLVDCDKVDSGCSGGLMDNGFKFLEQSGSCTESSYPYTGSDGSCRQSSCTKAISAGGVTGYHDVNGESGLESAVAQQPVSVAIEADQQGFQLYKSGVFSGACGTQLDHGVLAVGFGTDSGTPYWKVKNSWGSSWGDAGYIRMVKGSNQCGIGNQPSYPSVSGSVAVAEFEAEWSEFQAVQGQQNGEIPEAFKANVRAAKANNAANTGFTMGWTGPFAAMTKEEYKGVLGYSGEAHRSLPNLGEHVATEVTVGSVDWTTKGAVTPVKNQGQCGSCWAFSTTGSTEGAFFLAGNQLTSLSEQQLVDCDKVDSGCSGGLMDNGFKFLEQSGSCTESTYPYTGSDGSCRQSSCTKAIPAGGVTGYHDVNGESGLESAVAQQPVSVAIEADQQGFQLYKSGVFSGACGTQLDHGVLAVGFGTESGTPYWKVKNSWGSSWGDAGYIRMVKGSNQCGIGNQPSYPSVSGSMMV